MAALPGFLLKDPRVESGVTLDLPAPRGSVEPGRTIGRAATRRQSLMHRAGSACWPRGLLLAYGFNYPEAHRSFMQAAELDPDCAMCWWGAAWVLGPNINAAMDPAQAPEAWRLLQEAQAAERASAREQAYIQALAERYGPEALEDRSPRDQAFAEAMGRVAERFPDDLDAQVIYVEALMDTTPWDYWREDGEPKGVTQTVLERLQNVLRRAPEHPMANHLLIHAVEAATPERGLEEARRLRDLAPGVGHLVHMPAHIYTRVGRYHDASLSNQRAIEADQRYLEHGDSYDKKSL